MELRSSSFSSGEFSFSSSTSSTAEIEAAEALADLAHWATRKKGGNGSNKRGNKRKRVMKRVKSESPLDDSVSISATPTFVADSDQAGMNPDETEPVCMNGMVSTPKTEADWNFPKPSPNSTKCSPSFGGGRSRQNLTEAEKESRRLQRILANRESARQTIRRRQAMCEELTRKAADLSWENENLKREKELALKEFEALETTNKNLKAQIAVKVIKAQAEESQRDPKSACVEMPINPATNRPYLLYNHHSLSPICWPSVIQSSNDVHPHHGPQNAIYVRSNYPMAANAKLDSSQHQQENSINVNEPRGSLYMLPYPWFFPVPDHGNGIHSQPSPGFKHINDETSASNGSIKSSSAVSALEENKHYSMREKVKPEAPPLTEVRVINDLNVTPTGLSPDESGECADPHAQEMIFSSAGLNSVVPVKNESGLGDGIFEKASRLVNSLPEQGRNFLKLPNKKSIGAAAEARKRRKELTKLKNLYGRQCRTSC